MGRREWGEERKEKRENREKRRLEECRQSAVEKSQNSAVEGEVSSENQKCESLRD